VIRVEGLGQALGAVRAVDGLSFDVRAGETFALIGPNGAGKTTTLKCLLGSLRPDAGRIAIGAEGLPARRPARARVDRLGAAARGVRGRPHGRRGARFFAELRGLGPGAVEAAIERVGLGAYAKRRASELSGGYSQRLSLAQALLGDPALLVLDEPTASLDPQATWEFRSLVLELKAQGRTILLCSHLLDEVERVADRVLILVGGRAAALESMADLRRARSRRRGCWSNCTTRRSARSAVLAARGCPARGERRRRGDRGARGPLPRGARRAARGRRARELGRDAASDARGSVPRRREGRRVGRP